MFFIAKCYPRQFCIACHYPLLPTIPDAVRSSTTKSNQIKSNQIKSNQMTAYLIELHLIELKKCSKWKRQGLNFAQFYPELFCVLHICSMLLTTAMLIDCFSDMKTSSMRLRLKWTIDETGWNCVRLWILTLATATHGWPVMLITAQCCQLLLCGQVQYKFNWVN